MIPIGVEISLFAQDQSPSIPHENKPKPHYSIHSLIVNQSELILPVGTTHCSKNI